MHSSTFFIKAKVLNISMEKKDFLLHLHTKSKLREKITIKRKCSSTLEPTNNTKNK